MTRPRWVWAMRAWGIAGAWVCGLILGALPVRAGDIEYVIHISVDALHARAVPMWGPDEVPNFWRFRTEGSFTDNARTDYKRTNTTPNHTTIFTGRPIAGTDGHLWGENKTNDPYAAYGFSIHAPHTGSPFNTSAHNPQKSAYEYVFSVFDVVHDAGGRTAEYYGKQRMNLHMESYTTWGRAAGATGSGDPTVSKIDSHLYKSDTNTQQLIDTWLDEMDANPFNYSFIHFSKTDHTGHSHNWSMNKTSDYMTVVKEVDGWLGEIFNLIETDARFIDKTAIVLTADHGGLLGTGGHGTVTEMDNYRVPLYVWGPGVAAGGDLYQMNSQYTNPGSTRPDHSDANNQPIRCGDTPNLVLQLLGLSAIPGSVMNADLSMNVSTIIPSSSIVTPYGPNLGWDAAAAKNADRGWGPNVNKLASDPYLEVGGSNQPTRTTFAADPDTQGITAAYVFNGSDDSPLGPTVSFQDVSGDTTNDSVSIEMWFKPDGLGNGKQVLWSMGGATDGTSITLDGDVLRLQVRDSDVRPLAGGDGAEDLVVVLKTQLTAGQAADFIQVVGVIDMEDTGPKVTLYVNGVLASAISGGDAGTGLFLDDTATTGPTNSFVQVGATQDTNPTTAEVPGQPTVDLGDWAGTGAVHVGRRAGDVGGQSTDSDLNLSGFENKTFQGQIAVINVYGTDLNAEQVQANYQSVAGGANAPATPAGATDFAVNYDANVGIADDTWSDRSLEVSGTRGQWYLAGVTLASADPSKFPGINKAFDFAGSGSSDGGTLATDLSLADLIGGGADTGDASFEIWFKPDTLSGNQVLFETGDSTDGVSIRLSGSVLQFATCDTGRTDGGTDDSRVLSFELDANVDGLPDSSDFIQVVGVIDLDTEAAAGTESGTLRLFVNGTEIVGARVTGYMGADWDGGGAAGLGRFNGTLGGGGAGFLDGAPLDGQIGLFRAYNRALSAGEVASNFAATVPEPGTMGLLALGGCALLARRRRKRTRPA